MNPEGDSNDLPFARWLHVDGMLFMTSLMFMYCWKGDYLLLVCEKLSFGYL